MNKRFKQSILLLGDIAVLYLTLLISLLLRFLGQPLNVALGNNLPYFIPVFAIWLIALYIGGAYNLNLAYNPRRFKLMAINAITFSALFSII